MVVVFKYGTEGSEPSGKCNENMRHRPYPVLIAHQRVRTTVVLVPGCFGQAAFGQAVQPFLIFAFRKECTLKDKVDFIIKLIRKLSG